MSTSTAYPSAGMAKGSEPVLEVSDMLLAQGVDTNFTIRVPTLCLCSGDLICLSGESGSGKSTLLDTLALLAGAKEVRRYLFRPVPGMPALDFAPSLRSGKMQVLAHHRSGAIGYAPQSGGMLPFLSARDDALSPALLGHVLGFELQERFAGLARELRLNNDLTKTRSALSGGQRKRLSLLRALAVPRRLLVLDEPTAGVDEPTADRALALIAKICRDEGTACIIASHDRQRIAAAGFRTLTVARLPSVNSAGSELQSHESVETLRNLPMAAKQ